MEVSMSKRTVASWDSVTSFTVTFPDDSVLGEGAADVSVEVGRGEGGWYVRTHDDAGGSDDGPSDAFDSYRDALRAANALAEERDEANDGEDAKAYIDRRLWDLAREGAAEDGEYLVVWATTDDDDREEDGRYSTYDAASAACNALNEMLHSNHPSGSETLLCGYEVHLADGTRLDDDGVAIEDYEDEVLYS